MAYILSQNTPAASIPNAPATKVALFFDGNQLKTKDSTGTVVTYAGNAAGGSNTEIQFNNAGVLDGSSSLTWDGTFVGIDGNLIFTASGNRIYGDLSNLISSDRLQITNSIINGDANLSVVPNGTSTNATIQVENASITGNNSYLGFSIYATGSRVVSTRRGAGPFLPISIVTGGGKFGYTQDISGNVAIGEQSGLLTTATDGFLYLQSMAGTPTGIPNAPVSELGAMTDKTAITVDILNDKLYFYSNGAWRDAGGTGTVPGGANTQIQFNNAGTFDGNPELTWDGVFLGLDGNLNFNGIGNRIYGDWSGDESTGASFQSNVTNADTFLLVIPNGTATRSLSIYKNSTSLTDFVGTYAGIGASGASVFGNYTVGTATPMITELTANNIAGVTIGVNGSAVIGNPGGLLTTATDRFAYISAMPGTPTGVPIPFGGAVPITIDNVNNKLYFYSGGLWVDSTGGGGGTVTSVNVAGTPGNITSSGGPITTAGTITVNLATTAVTPGSYTASNITVDAYGRITAAANGTPAASAPDYESAVATASQTVFNTTLSTVANGSGKAYLQVFRNGLKQQEGAGKHYTVTGANQVTFNAGLTLNDDVEFYAFV